MAATSKTIDSALTTARLAVEADPRLVVYVVHVQRATETEPTRSSVTERPAMLMGRGGRYECMPKAEGLVVRLSYVSCEGVTQCWAATVHQGCDWRSALPVPAGATIVDETV